MAVREQDVELIVKQILEQMSGSSSAPVFSTPSVANGEIPSTARVAMLTELEKFELNSSISNAIDLTNSEAFAIGRKDAENKMQGTSMDRGDLGGDFYWPDEIEKEAAARLDVLRGKARTPDEEKEYNDLRETVKRLQEERSKRS